MARVPRTISSSSIVYFESNCAIQIYTDIDPQQIARNPHILQLIARGMKPNRPGPQTLPFVLGLNDDIWEMCMRCWEISPIDRPPMQEVLPAFIGNHEEIVLPCDDEFVKGKRFYVDTLQSQRALDAELETYITRDAVGSNYRARAAGQLIAVKALNVCVPSVLASVRRSV